MRVKDTMNRHPHMLQEDSSIVEGASFFCLNCDFFVFYDKKIAYIGKILNPGFRVLDFQIPLIPVKG
jgi:hypothetical protein